MTIEINRMGGWGFCPRTFTIHGDGSVEIIVHEAGGHEASQINIQIETDQLHKIVSAFEEANFFGISYGCVESHIVVKDAGYTNISVETHGNSHAIKDEGGCSYFYFDKYCGLADRIEEIFKIEEKYVLQLPR